MACGTADRREVQNCKSEPSGPSVRSSGRQAVRSKIKQAVGENPNILNRAGRWGECKIEQAVGENPKTRLPKIPWVRVKFSISCRQLHR